MDVEQWAAKAEQARTAMEMYGEGHAKAAAEEILLEAQRGVLKNRIADSLLGTDNPKTKRPHSAESAKDAAAVSEEYLAHVKLLSETVHRKNSDLTLKDSAKLQGQLCVAMVKAEAGVA